MSSNDSIINGRYELISQLGSGGMAVIYKAVDLSLRREVAIKVLRPGYTDDPSFLVRFQNEARAVANLSHPNIVTVHDVGETINAQGKRLFYMVMEYVKGEDLKKYIREKSPLNVDQALYFAIQICAGIGFAHRAGLVHADIKPQNILLTGDDIVKVTDFGIAQAWSDTQPQSSEREAVVWGSPHYFSPEQARGERPTAASDVYSIGIVMFEMLTGRLPYLGASQHELALAHLREPVPRASEVVKEIPQELDNLVYRVMSKEATARFRTADQLGHVLIGYRDRGRQKTINVPSQNIAPSTDSRPNTPLTTQPSQPVTPQQGTGGTSRQNPSVQPPNVSPSVPTQRVNMAPEAPVYSRGIVQPAQPIQERHTAPPQQQYPIPPNAAPQGQAMGMQQQQTPFVPPLGQTGPYVARPQESTRGEPVRLLDPVTIILAVLAFIAVMGLIPLYLLVLQSYL